MVRIHSQAARGVLETIREAEFKTQKRVHWAELRQKHSLTTEVGKTLNAKAHPRIFNAVKQVVASHSTLAKPVEQKASLDTEKNALTALFDAEFKEDCKEKQALAKFVADVIDESSKVQGAKPGPNGLTEAQMAAKNLLGQLIYLFDANKDETLKKIAGTNLAADKKAIQDSFTAALKTLAKDVNDAVNAEIVFTLNRDLRGNADATSLRAAIVPKAIANALITQSGFLNLAISKSVQTALFQQGSYSFQTYLAQTLQQYENHPELQAMIQQLDAVQANSNSLELVLASSYDPSKVTGSRADVQRAFFGAHLTLLEQGNVGDCFAVSICKMVQEMLPQRTGQDLTSLIKTSALTVKVDGKDKKLDYAMTGNDPSLQVSFKVDLTGNITLPKGWLTLSWSAPTAPIANSQALTRATRAMGIKAEDHQKAVVDAINSIATSDPKTKVTQVEITAEELIYAIAQNEVAKELANEGAKDVAKDVVDSRVYAKTDKGYFGFCSLANNNVLRAWAETMAAYAELSKTSYVRGRILRSFQEALLPEFTSKKAPKDDVLKTVFDSVLVTLNDTLKIQYKDNTKTPDPSAKASDGHSTVDGAFVMEGIENPLQFRTFVMDSIKANFAAQTGDAKAIVEKKAAKINEYVMSNVFLQKALTSFDPANQSLEDADKDWASLSALPWRDPTGDNPFEIMDFYFGKSQKLDGFKPKNAQELWVGLLEFSKKVEARKAELRKLGQDERFEIANEIHAFNFLINDPTFQAGVTDPKAPAQFVADYMKQAEKLYQDVKITKEQREALLAHVKKYLVSQDAEIQTNFDHSTAILNVDDETSLMNIRTHLATVLNALTPEDAVTRYLSKLDKHLLATHLPKGTVDEMQKLVVPFADSNWTDDGHSIYFCFYPDPIAKQLRFGMVYDDGTNLQPMDQDEWVNNQEWDLTNTAINTTV